jgi:hypothetical protein
MENWADATLPLNASNATAIPRDCMFLFLIGLVFSIFEFDVLMVSL